MSDNAPFIEAMAAAKKQAARAGLVIHHCKWDAAAQHLEWLGRPKKEAMKLASGSEISFQGKRGEIVSLEIGDAERPSSKRGIAQGQLL